MPAELISKLFGYESFDTLRHYGLESLDGGQECDETNALWAVIEQIRAEKGGAYQ